MHLDAELRVKINDKDKGEIEDVARDLGLTLSAFVRTTLKKEVKKINSNGK